MRLVSPSQAANCFYLVDTVREGTLSFNSFCMILRAVINAEGLTGEPDQRNLQNMFRLADMNGDNCIDFNEFLRFYSLYINTSLKALHDTLRASRRAV